MDPKDFLNVARDLSGSQWEEERRTSVGRSYYAVFNCLRERVHQIITLPGDAEDHAALVQYLTKANNRDLSSVGQSLKDLRASRNIADYDMAQVVDAYNTEMALRWADRALQRFDAVSDVQLRGALQAQETYKRRS